MNTFTLKCNRLEIRGSGGLSETLDGTFFAVNVPNSQNGAQYDLYAIDTSGKKSGVKLHTVAIELRGAEAIVH